MTSVATKVKFKLHANDPDTLILQCGICGSVGDVMSRNWSYSETEKNWVPQPQHVPPCAHFVAERLSAVDTPTCVRETQTAYMPNGMPPRWDAGYVRHK